uniref:Nucleic acid-binding protein n=1 Tax=Heterorhabditis bacteriophora TaxID=37862 RepID=A0A1I7XMA2_HETBA
MCICYECGEKKYMGVNNNDEGVRIKVVGQELDDTLDRSILCDILVCSRFRNGRVSPTLVPLFPLLFLHY